VAGRVDPAVSTNTALGESLSLSGHIYDPDMTQEHLPSVGANLGLGCPLLDSLSHRYSADGDCQVVELDISDNLRGPGGAVHGGLVASLVDCAGASAVARASGRLPATSNLSISYLAAGRVGPLRAVAEPLRIGKNHGVAEIHVYDVGKEERLVATALVTVNFLDGTDFTQKTV